MELVLYKNFQKRINSTKQPTSEGALTLDVKLKQDTSLEAPTFILSGVDFEYNYCKFNNHYYYINDIRVLTNDLVEISCTQDLLATYKDAIGNTSAFVEYSTKAFNTLLADSRISLTENVASHSVSAPLNLGGENGSIVLTVAGANLNAQVGLTSAYSVTSAGAEGIALQLYDNEDLQTLLSKFLNHPYEAIIEAHWIPFSVGASGQYVYLGSYDTGIGGKGLTSEMSKSATTYTLQIPWTFNDYRDFKPYSNLELYLPFYGVVNLDASRLKGIDSLTINVIMDAISGEINYMLEASTFITSFKVDTSVALPVGQLTGRKLQSVASIVGGVGAIVGAGASALVSGGATLPMIASAIGGVTAIGNGALNYFSDTPGSKGGSGGFASGNQVLRAPSTSYAKDITLTLVSHTTATDPIAMAELYGRPLFANRQLSTLSGGYIKCAGASVNIGGLGNDKEVINTYLNGGFYYE